MGLEFVISTLILAKTAADTQFHIGFLPAMTNINKNQSSKLYNKHMGKEYAGAIEVAMQDLRRNPVYSNLTFSYIFKVSTFSLSQPAMSIAALVDECLRCEILPAGYSVRSRDYSEGDGSHVYGRS